MRGILAATAASGTVAGVSWITFMVLRPLIFAEGLSQLVTGVIVVSLVLFWLVSPLVAGVIGGRVSRSFLGVAGSMVGYLAVDAAGFAIQGLPPTPIGALVLWFAAIGALLAVGHSYGMTIRRRLRAA